MLHYTRTNDLDTTLARIAAAAMKAGADATGIDAAVRAAAQEALHFAQRAIGRQYAGDAQKPSVPDAQKPPAPDTQKPPAPTGKALAGDPNPLLDAVKAHLMLDTDRDLCQVLDIAPPVVSKLRHRALRVGPAMLMRLHAVTGWSIAALKERMGDPSPGGVRERRSRAAKPKRSASFNFDVIVTRSPDQGDKACEPGTGGDQAMNMR